jgi:hypothetical protein
MVPVNNTGMQQNAPFPMGDRTVLLQTAMVVERMLRQLAPLSPTMAMLVDNFIINFQKTLVESLPEQSQQPAPSSYGNLASGAQQQPQQF